MAIRVSGLISGLDTDSIVQELVKAYSTKKDKYVKAQTKLEWKMDSWKTMNSKIYGFYTSSLSGMRLSSGYSLKSSTISDTNVAKVTASAEAVNGTQTLQVKQLAATSYVTSAVLKKADGSTDDVKGDTKLTELGITAGSKVKINDKEIEITSDMNLNNFVGILKDAGLNASYDEANKRLFISASKSGEEAEFSLTAANTAGVNAIVKLGLFAKKDIDGNDTAEMIKYKEILDDSSKFGTDEYAAADLMVNGKILTTDEKTAQETKLAQALADRAAAESVTKPYEEQQAIVDKYNQALDIISRYEASDDTVSKEEYDKAVEFKTESDKTDSDYQNALEYVNDTDKKDAYNNAKVDLSDAVNRINAANAALAASEAASGIGGAARISGRDSEIVLNGAEYKSATGTFSINGLSITAMEVTGDKTVTINTATDTKGIYDKIKTFLKNYNELITAMDKAYNAESAKDYEPLTDEEKEEMTDSQIEKWETKIKDSLLRRDSTLGNVSSSMKALMQSSFEIDGKTYSLSTFGISTQGYFASDVNERGCYHIDGDADDALTSGNTDKLMAAINSDPDKVVQFFQKLAQNVYNDLTNKMASSSSSSAFTIYNDKQMSSEYSKYKDDIDKWNEKLEYYEDYYYKQFSAMEKALSELQSKTSSLGQLLGGQ